MEKVAIVEYISASTAGVVNISLGFQPDFALIVQDHGGTNPNIRVWCNNARFSNWAAALALLITGSTGVITRDTASATVYAGGDTVGSTTENSDPKYIGRAGTIFASGTITSPGLTIPAGDQTNSGRNLLIAFRSSI